MPTGAATTQAAPKEVAVLEGALDRSEGHLRKAHAIVDRMAPRSAAEGSEAASGALAAASRINEDLANLCDRLEDVADKVGPL